MAKSRDMLPHRRSCHTPLLALETDLFHLASLTNIATVSNEDDNLFEDPSNKTPNPMERNWIHPSELPSLSTTARNHREKTHLPIRTGALLLCLAGVAGLFLLTHHSHQRVVATPAPLSPGIVSVSDSAKQHAIGVALDGGTLIVVAIPGVVGDAATVTTARGLSQTAHVVAVDSALGYSLFTTTPALITTPLPSASLAAAATQSTEALTGSSLTHLTRTSLTGSSAFATVGGQDLGVIKTSLTTLSTGVLLNQAGRPEGLLCPRIGAGIGLPIATVATHAVLDRDHVTHGWLQIEAVTANAGGVRVTQVGPASRAALASGDRITQINETPLATSGDLLDALYGIKAGSTVTLSVQRKGVELTEHVTLSRHP